MAGMIAGSAEYREQLREDYNPADYAPDGYYDECSGEFYPFHEAGDRFTGPRPLAYSYGGRTFVGDPLVVMAGCRKRMLAAKRDGAWDAGSRVAQYEYFRLVAMRPSSRSRLLQAEMLALASSYERKANALVAAMRGAA